MDTGVLERRLKLQLFLLMQEEEYVTHDDSFVNRKMLRLQQDDVASAALELVLEEGGRGCTCSPRSSPPSDASSHSGSTAGALPRAASASRAGTAVAAGRTTR